MYRHVQCTLYFPFFNTMEFLYEHSRHVYNESGLHEQNNLYFFSPDCFNTMKTHNRKNKPLSLSNKNKFKIEAYNFPQKLLHFILSKSTFTNWLIVKNISPLDEASTMAYKTRMSKNILWLIWNGKSCPEYILHP